LFKYEGGSLINFRDNRALDAVKDDEGQKVELATRTGKEQ
jgi:hypothetical protein